jgi:hypothetical protein
MIWAALMLAVGVALVLLGGWIGGSRSERFFKARPDARDRILSARDQEDAHAMLDEMAEAQPSVMFFPPLIFGGTVIAIAGAVWLVVAAVLALTS